MFLELNSILDIDKDYRFNNQVIGLSDSHVDGNFLVQHFLSFFLKKGIPVCFVGLHHTSNHYNIVAQKFGLNLSNLISTKKLNFVGGLKLLGEAMYKQTFDSNAECERVPEKDSPFTDNTQLKNFKLYIENIYNELKELNGQSPVIIIDNLSVLLSVGYPVQEILSLIHYLTELLLQSLSDSGGTLVLFCNNFKDFHDEDNELLWNYTKHTSSLQLEVSGLKTGYCKEVHGELSVKWNLSLLPSKKEKKMQFRLHDKNVTFFSAGLSSAVL